MIHDPTPEAVATARQRAGHTQAQAAAAVGMTARAWQQYESGDRSMPASAWWLYLLRVGRITLADLPAIPERQRAAVRVG
ncbi:helix-turn-helix transcriptional regulator [Methyloversatilis discipulorum]|uniref:helix-turn-helix domain-containing protein n=1 Tax=Methyloversatilis discipulorum TaxID=1119528 RepID=UPI0031384612